MLSPATSASPQRAHSSPCKNLSSESPQSKSCFTVSWANFLYGLAFTTSVDQLTVLLGIVTTLIKGDVYAWGQIMTGALLGAVPPLIILMDDYIAGLTAGATKG